MTVSGMQPVVLSHDAPVIPAKNNVRRIVVFLPDAPARMLNTLQQAAALLENSTTPLPMLILSRSPAIWLWQTLQHQVMNQQLLVEVRAAASDLPVSSLVALLQDYILEKYPSLEQLADEETRLCGKRPGGLTRPELNAILGLLSGCSVSALAKRRGISNKTLYNQRTAGLKKMIDHYPQLAPHFPRTQMKENKYESKIELTIFEREFVHAIHSRQVFPVFQPITDEFKKIHGIEILPRWNRHGEVLPPCAFLTQICSDYVWLLLTAFVLQEAVQSINQHPGEFYFSINIPTSIAGNENLLRMMETARQQLQRPQMASRLVLEFAETANFNAAGKTAKNISQLKKRGFHIMLDDCYSKSSVMFPVRTFRFSAYKLGIDIVKDMLYDSHAMALVKSLLYYCNLTGSRCIAEGVDSLEKFNTLKGLGVDRFQGYFISAPVVREKIIDLIHQL